MADPFGILIVCTANQCRSPIAEFIMRQAAGQNGIPWQISSAGTHARQGLAMHTYAARILRSRGVATNGWRTRRVERWMLDGNALILTATRQHRSMLLSARPDLIKKTFPLLQFAALARSARPEASADPLSTGRDGDNLLEAVRGAQGQVQPPQDDVDLDDPVGHSYRRFQACGTTIENAIDQIIAAAR